MTDRELVGLLAESMIVMRNSDHRTQMIGMNLWAMARNGRELQVEELAGIIRNLEREVDDPEEGGERGEPDPELAEEFQGITPGQARLVLAKLGVAGIHLSIAKAVWLTNQFEKQTGKVFGYDPVELVKDLMTTIDQNRDLPGLLAAIDEVARPMGKFNS